MSEHKNENFKKPNTCWVCLRINPKGGLSNCPRSWGMHNDPPDDNWKNTEKYTNEYFPNVTTAPLCFDCAH